MRRIAEISAISTCADMDSTEADSSSAALNQAISESELSQRILVAVELAASRNAASMEALRIAVCEFTIALRGEGRTPEAVLISLKNIITRKSLPVLPRYSTDWSGNELRSSVSTWCINAYFSEEAGCT